MTTRARVFAAMLVLCGGCADRTSILVEVSSDDLTVPADIDGLQFQAQTGAGHSLDESYAIGSAWPHSLTLLPATSQEGRVTITVTGLRGGRPVVRRIVESAFSAGEQRTVLVRLQRACLGLPCPEGVDCVSGLCVGLDGDGGVDAGVDGGAGPIDGGSMDSGLADSGVMDAGASDGGSPRDGGVDAGAPDGGSDAGRAPPMLLFTEYVEGSSNNKALEIHNLAGASFDLSRCTLHRYTNGATTPFDIPLTGTVPAGGYFVVCHSLIEIATACDQLTGALNHNGDDAYSLTCDGSATPLDTFGQLGFDPGTAWSGAAGLSTAEYQLTRRCGVTAGDTDGSDAFDPSVEWEGRAWMDAGASLAGLGSRAECP